jgi:rRNA-processing protein FCF1
MSAKRLDIVIPSQIWDRLEKASKEHDMTIEDLLMRAVIQVIEELEKEGRK